MFSIAFLPFVAPDKVLGFSRSFDSLSGGSYPFQTAGSRAYCIPCCSTGTFGSWPQAGQHEKRWQTSARCHWLQLFYQHLLHKAELALNILLLFSHQRAKLCPLICVRGFSVIFLMQIISFCIIHWLSAVWKVQQMLCKAYMSVLSSSENSIQVSKIETAPWWIQV